MAGIDSILETLDDGGQAVHGQGLLRHNASFKDPGTLLCRNLTVAETNISQCSLVLSPSRSSRLRFSLLLAIMGKIQDTGQSGGLVVSFLTDFQIPISHGQHQDSLRMPIMRQDDSRVRMRCKQHTEKLAHICSLNKVMGRLISSPGPACQGS